MHYKFFTGQFLWKNVYSRLSQGTGNNPAVYWKGALCVNKIEKVNNKKKKQKSWFLFDMVFI